MINTTSIYFLHKGDNIPFYIGKTLTPLKTRLNHHRWKFNDQSIQISLLDKIPSEEWKFWEEWYIELFLYWGFDLYGIKTKKGRGPGNRKCVWGDKISQSTKGKNKNYTPEERERRSKRGKIWGYSNKGIKYNNEQKKSITEGRRQVYYQYDLQNNFIKEWHATKCEIASHFGKDHSGITHNLKGRQKSAYGFIWKSKV